MIEERSDEVDDGIRVGSGSPVFLILRVLLAAALLWFVCGETGGATTLALALVYINTEATDYWVRLTQKNIDMLVILAKRWGGIA